MSRLTVKVRSDFLPAFTSTHVSGPVSEVLGPRACIFDSGSTQPQIKEQHLHENEAGVVDRDAAAKPPHGAVPVPKAGKEGQELGQRRRADWLVPAAEKLTNKNWGEPAVGPACFL